MKHWLTTIFGAITAIAGLAHASGITIGHVGATDWITLIGTLSAAGIGVAAADANKVPRH